MSRNRPQTAWRPVCPDLDSEHVPHRRSARKLRRGRVDRATVSAATYVLTHLACRSRPSPQQNRPRHVKQTPAFPTPYPKAGLWSNNVKKTATRSGRLFGQREQIPVDIEIERLERFCSG